MTAKIWRHMVMAGVLVLACLPGAPRAMAADDPYAATVPEGVPGPEATPRAWREALRQVLVRVTGLDAAGRDEALIARIGDPARLARDYRRDGAGNLTVNFDEKALASRIRAGGYRLLNGSATPVPAGPPAGNTRVTVSGLGSFPDYGAMLRRLGAIAGVTGVRVLGAGVAGVEIELDLRTDVASFLALAAQDGAFSVAADGAEESQDIGLVWRTAY